MIEDKDIIASAAEIEKRKWELEKLLYQDRTRFHMEGVKALLLINGAAAVALLAFLEEVWGIPRQRGLVWPVLLALLVFALGILLVPRVYFLRTNANFALFERNTASDQGNHELAKKKQAELNNFGDRISRLTQISLVCFGGGVFIVVIGAVLSLIFGEPYSAPSAPLSPLSPGAAPPSP